MKTIRVDLEIQGDITCKALKPKKLWQYVMDEYFGIGAVVKQVNVTEQQAAKADPKAKKK